MSRLVSRILLSIFMFPLAIIFYGIVMAITESNFRTAYSPNRETEMFLISSCLTWFAVGGYWCLLWRSAVDWNSFRIRGTILATIGSAFTGALVATFTGFLLGAGNISFGVFLGGILTILMWLIATVFIWRETPTERAARIQGANKSAITCPTCGYNLTGLTESRCPECGSKFTIDELLALQSKNDRNIE